MNDALTPTQRAVLAEKCGIHDQYLYQILTGRKVASPELATQLELASDALLTRKVLRPDDWPRIWPELAAAPVQMVEVVVCAGSALGYVGTGIHPAPAI